MNARIYTYFKLMKPFLKTRYLNGSSFIIICQNDQWMHIMNNQKDDSEHDVIIFLLSLWQFGHSSFSFPP